MIHDGVIDNSGEAELGMVAHVCNPKVGKADRRIPKASWSVAQLNVQALGVPMRLCIKEKQTNKT